MSESDEDFNDEKLWETELEIALLTKCDYGTIRSITKLRPIPEGLRTKVWKVCLDVQQEIEDNEISKWKEEYDLPQQSKIREECQHVAEKLHPNDAEKQLMVTSLAETVLTYYCKTNDESFEKDNGWIEILYPILSLNLNKNETYNFFQAILRRYIPKDCVPNGSPYHLFRLLMLYHDPELCAYLDTRKIATDSYSHIWFRSLFAANTHLNVTFHLWDMYFQLGDQFLVFFMSLILVFNIREEIMSSQDMEKPELMKHIQSSPASLDAGDLFDFNGLCQHFAAKTPQSFRKIFYDVIVKEYKKPLFEGISLGKKASSIYQALCLPVSVDELLQANQLGVNIMPIKPGLEQPQSGVRYFIIDCRPAEKYNASHYATAFHLDANLMLENPSEFNQSVEALLAAQKQAINAGSVAGGQHLCFMGTGIDEEDNYVNMVVSNFLQRKINFVSLALGGYKELLRMSADDPEMIVGTDVQHHDAHRAKFTEEWVKKINSPDSSASSMFNKFSSVFSFNKLKSGDIKDKLKDYVLTPLNNTATAAANKKQINMVGEYFKQIKLDYSNIAWLSPTILQGASSSLTSNPHEKHVSASDKVGKLYRNQGNVFAIDDDANDDESMSERVNGGGSGNGEGSETGGNQHKAEYVNLKVWLERPDVISKFNCFYRERKEGGKIEWVPGYLLLTKTHLYGLTQKSSRRVSSGMVEITVRHPLNSIIKIATKSSCPEIISFTYGEKMDKPRASAAAAAAVDNDDSTAKQEETSSVSSSKEAKNQLSDYLIKGKEWFYVPEYSGEAASAVKRQILEIVDLIH